jgi:hypothetical protein
MSVNLFFSNPIRFPPARFAGIIVLRPPSRTTPGEISQCFSSLVAALSTTDSITGKLWIVSPSQIRQYVPAD